MDFEDLVPQEQRVVYPKTSPEMLGAARKALSEPVPKDKFEAIIRLPKGRKPPKPAPGSLEEALAATRPKAFDFATYKPPIPEEMGFDVPGPAEPSGTGLATTLEKVAPQGPQLPSAKSITTPQAWRPTGKTQRDVETMQREEWRRRKMAEGEPVRGPMKDIEDVVGYANQLIAGTSPYEKDKFRKGEIDLRLEWALRYYATLGGRLGGKGLRKKLLEETETFPGYFPALAPAVGETGVLAIEWGWLYPKLFKLAGFAGSKIAQIPKVAQGIKALESMGGLQKVAQKHPHLYSAGKEALKAFTKGEAVGQTMAAVESVGKEKSIEEWIADMNKRGALLGGVATVFSAAHSYDQYKYVQDVSRQLRKMAYARHTQRVQKGMTEKASAEMVRQEGDKIQDVIYYLENEMLGAPRELYGGKKPKLSAKEAAVKLAREGYNFSQTGKIAQQLKGIKRPRKRLTLEEEVKQLKKAAAARPTTTTAKTYQEAYNPQTGQKVVIPDTIKAKIPKGWEVSEPKPLEAPPPVKPTTVKPVAEGKVEIEKIAGVEVAKEPGPAKALETIREEGQKKADLTILMPKNLEDESEFQRFVEQFTKFQDVGFPAIKAQKAIIQRIKKFAQGVPEFKLNPTFTFDKESGQLVFKDRYRFAFYPSHFGLDAEALTDGQTIRFDLESFGVKPPTKKALKTAEAFLGEPKILGKVTKKPTPVKLYGERKRKPRKITKAKKEYYAALVDVELGKKVEVPGGVTYSQVTEKDIERAAKLGKKANQTAWAVERTILASQQRGSAEKPVDIGTAVKIIRDVFSEVTKPAPKAKAEKLTTIQTSVGTIEIPKDELEGNWQDALETIFDYGNQAQAGKPVQTGLSRSLSMGDTVEYEGKTWLVMPTGWQDVSQLSKEQIDKLVGEGKIPIPPKPKPAEEASQFVPPKTRAKKPTLDFEDLVPRSAEVKHIKNVVLDIFRDWPKGIKQVGRDYWTEVMAVAKKLLTPYRYKALRQTMLGAFRHKKGAAPQVVGIELQDVTDALTATHELGHNIDWLLNNKVFPSSIKKRFPDSLGGEFGLRNELKAVSKLLRPDMWEKPRAYIKSHPELMADYISLYILDPEKAKELAPKVTRAFEAKIANKPELFDTISRLQESRYEGPQEPVVAEHIRKDFPLPKEHTPLQLIVDMMDKDYVKAAEELGIKAARDFKLLMSRARTEADRIDKLVPNKDRQIDLVVIAENGSKNPWTGKTRQEIVKGGLTANEHKAITLFRANQERARQTVNKYLRGANIAEYIKFIEDYFIHSYDTPMSEKYKTAIARWAKRSPQAKKRILPDLATAVEIGLKPRAKTLSDGLRLWAGMNYRVATNVAFLRILPKITNDDGVSILQKPQDYPYWPTVDYWPIRQTYRVPLQGRGILLFQGRVAVDPRVKPFIDAMFGRRVFNTPVRVIEGLNAIWKAFQLTLFSFFHHQAEFFSACGSLGPRALPFVGGYYGKRAQAFGKKKLFGFLPARIGILEAGRELEKVPEFMEDYIAAGGQRGYISTMGINLIERMLKGVEDYLKNIIQTKPIAGKFVWPAYVPAVTTRATYSWFQHLLWDNVNRAKLVSYYHIVADGAKNSDLPIKDVKELAVEYINDNFGGQEWLNTMFRNPKTRQFWTQLMLSLDWTWSQIKTARWPLGIGGKNAERRAFMRRIGRHHWFWYLAAISSFTIAASYAMSGKGPWENEIGYRLHIDWTKIWRSLPWNKDWKQRGDYARRYMTLGKAGRELIRWSTHGLKAFGMKLSPVAKTLFEQGTGYNVGSTWAEPWAREDMEGYEEVYARFKHLMDNFKPYAFSGNNAFLAFPSRKGMTQWKAIRAFEELFKVRANIATGGVTAKLTKASHVLDRNREKLVKDIVEACVLNNVDWEKSMSAALSNTRSKYSRRFWNATKRQDIEQCNRYADAMLALGVTDEGFIQSMTERGRQLSREAVKTALETFTERQKKAKAK